jgi:hypothetical protein
MQKVYPLLVTSDRVSLSILTGHPFKFAHITLLKLENNRIDNSCNSRCLSIVKNTQPYNYAAPGSDRFTKRFKGNRVKLSRFSPIS